MKKLSLKKTTLSRLNDNALNNVKGGLITIPGLTERNTCVETIRDCQLLPTLRVCQDRPETGFCWSE